MLLVSPEKIAEYTQRGWWGTLTLWDHFVRNLLERPDAEAVVDAPNRAEFAHGAPRRLSWRDLAAEVDQLCLVLLEHQIGRDDIVVVMLPNCVEQFVVYLACLRLGVVITPVPVQYREHELEHILSLTDARAVFTFSHIGRPGRAHMAGAMFCKLRARHRSLTTILAWGDDPLDDVVHLGNQAALPLAAGQRQRVEQAARDAAITANDVVTICWTSGTEADPKGVPRNHNEWLIVPPSIIEAALLPPHARLLNPFPLVNMSGFSTAFATWLVLGGTVV